MPPILPANIDYIGVLIDLRLAGMCDYKIELICGLHNGYVAKMRSGAIRELKYSDAARLYNFWMDECWPTT